MKHRSPIRGYNHNIRYGGRLYHVQTEDSGIANPHIFTHLFHAGTILSSKRSDYQSADEDPVVQRLMQAQHKSMLRDLSDGLFDIKIAQFFGERSSLRRGKEGLGGAVVVGSDGGVLISVDEGMAALDAALAIPLIDGDTEVTDQDLAAAAEAATALAARISLPAGLRPISNPPPPPPPPIELQLSDTVPMPRLDLEALEALELPQPTAPPARQQTPARGTRFPPPSAPRLVVPQSWPPPSPSSESATRLPPPQPPPPPSAARLPAPQAPTSMARQPQPPPIPPPSSVRAAAPPAPPSSSRLPSPQAPSVPLRPPSQMGPASATRLPAPQSPQSFSRLSPPYDSGFTPSSVPATPTRTTTAPPMSPQTISGRTPVRVPAVDPARARSAFDLPPPAGSALASPQGAGDMADPPHLHYTPVRVPAVPRANRSGSGVVVTRSVVVGAGSASAAVPPGPPRRPNSPGGTAPHGHPALPPLPDPTQEPGGDPTIFGEDPYTDKSLDEVILAYLAEDSEK